MITFMFLIVNKLKGNVSVRSF